MKAFSRETVANGSIGNCITSLTLLVAAIASPETGALAIAKPA
jgi:hypothetical protein